MPYQFSVEALRQENPITLGEYTQLTTRLNQHISHNNGFRSIIKNILPPMANDKSFAKGKTSLSRLLKDLYADPNATIKNYRDMVNLGILIAASMLAFYADFSETMKRPLDQETQLFLLNWFASCIVNMLDLKNTGNSFHNAMKIMVMKVLVDLVNKSTYSTYFHTQLLINHTLSLASKSGQFAYRKIGNLTPLACSYKIMLGLIIASFVPEAAYEIAIRNQIKEQYSLIAEQYDAYIHLINRNHSPYFFNPSVRQILKLATLSCLAVISMACYQQHWTLGISAFITLLALYFLINIKQKWKNIFTQQDMNQQILAALDKIIITESSDSDSSNTANTPQDHPVYLHVNPIVLPALTQPGQAPTTKIVTTQPKKRSPHIKVLTSTPFLNNTQQADDAQSTSTKSTQSQHSDRPTYNNCPIYIANHHDIVGRDDSPTFAAAYAMMHDQRSFEVHRYSAKGKSEPNIFKIKFGNAATTDERFVMLFVQDEANPRNNCYVVCGFKIASHKKSTLSDSFKASMREVASRIASDHAQSDSESQQSTPSSRVRRR